MTKQSITADVTLAFTCLKAKGPIYDKLDAYYEGNQPTVYLTERLREVFKGVDATFTTNMCSIVIDSLLERINLTGFTVKEEAVQNLLSEFWEANQVNLEADDLHSAALTFGEGFIIVWKEADGEPVELYFNDSRLVHMFFDPEHPKQKRMAAKYYDEPSKKQCHLTLYYPDHLEYYTANKLFRDMTGAGQFEPDLDQYDPKSNTWPANPYEEIPVFQFKWARKVRSELYNVIPLQNGANKLMSDMMVAAEYGAFKQRWIISSSETEGKLPSRPGTNWDIPAGEEGGQPTSVGEFSATDLNNYLLAIDNLISQIGVTTRTPKHYFFAEGGDLSGEALIAMEAPLNKKAKDRIDRFIPTWKELLIFVCKLLGQVISEDDIVINFDKPETVQPKTQADITQIRVSSGVPLEHALRWEGKSEADIEAVMKTVSKEKTQAGKTLAQALLDAEKARDQEGNGDSADSSTQQKNPSITEEAPADKESD